MDRLPPRTLPSRIADRILEPLLKARKPKNSFEEYVGRKIRCMDGKTYTIETVTGSKFYPTRFEINGAHWVVILDFYSQMNNDKFITKQMIQDFDEMDFHVERQKEVKSETTQG